MNFKDNFSKQSAAYARFRPTYPPELFAYLASLTPAHDLAWDCGTGNGQAALGLADYYAQVYATDPSEQQIAHARPHERVRYRVQQAEAPTLDDHSVDLVTVAQALHWFRFDAFYAAVKRVLKPGGIFAAWAYGLPSVTPAVDVLINRFHHETVDAFWQPENRLIEKEYRTIPFPFEELPAPPFLMRKELTLADVTGLLRSWSAVQRYIDAHGTDPVNGLEPELARAWGNPQEAKTATWKLILKTGRV